MRIGQTGPRTGQRMPRWLIETGLLELVNVALFSWLVLVPGRALWVGRGGAYALVGLLTLAVVLAEGAGYWLGKARRLSKRRPGRGDPAARLRRLQVLYAANIALLLVFPVVVVAGVATRGIGTDLSGLAVGAGLYGFAVGEFVHYFLWKINMRSAERALARRGSRRIPARFSRELRRARAAASATRRAGTGKRASS